MAVHPPPYGKWLLVVAVIFPGMFLSAILAAVGNWPVAALGLGLGVLCAAVLYRRELRGLVSRRMRRETTDASRRREYSRSERIRYAYAVFGFLVIAGLTVTVLSATKGDRDNTEVGVVMTICGVGVGLWRINYEKNRR